MDKRTENDGSLLDLEKGVIIGGMSAPGDLDYIDVTIDEDIHYFRIEFY